jgi:hypothetical protein
MTLAQIHTQPLETEVARMIFATDQFQFYVIPKNRPATEAIPVGALPAESLVAFITTDPEIRAWLDSIYG